MSASELPRVDARIQRDEELLKRQEAIVQRAIEQRAGRGPAMMQRQQGRIPASRGRVHAGAQLAIGDAAGTGAAGAATANGRSPSSQEGEGNQWEKRAVRRYLGDMERKSRLYGRFEGIPESYNQKEADDWGAFFDQLNTEVDVPKYDVKNLLVDNIEAIPPCNMDCGKHGEVCLPPWASLITAKRCRLVSSSSSSSFSGQSDPLLPLLFFFIATLCCLLGLCGMLPSPLPSLLLAALLLNVPLLPLVQKDPKDFDWYNNLNTVNQRGKVVDNIDDITACLIDC